MTEQKQEQVDNRGTENVVQMLGNTSLTPFQHGWRVAVIWLIILGTPFWIRYFYYFFAPWLLAGWIIERRWRKKFNVAILPRRFLNWYRRSWIWEIYVRRCYLGSTTELTMRRLAGSCFALSLMFSIFWSSPSPVPELEELRKVVGTLESWRHERPGTKGGCGDRMTLRFGDGHKETFFNAKRKEENYLRMKDQEVTLWVQPQHDSIVPACRALEDVKQVQYDGKIIGLPYDKARLERLNRNFSMIPWFVFGMGALLLILIWLFNRNKDESGQIHINDW